ncbi:MAG: hypothetical protein P8H51_04755 [Flavobacteriaceae bacterium]|nr:hypothetical protein [Flavobacteriaceae bacterium]
MGGAIAIVAEHKLEMVKQGVEISSKKNIPNPYRSIKFSALLIGVAFGGIAGGILENTGAFYEAEMGYFASIFIFRGFALLIASLYINNRLSLKNL